MVKLVGFYTNVVPVFVALLAIEVLGEFFGFYHLIAIVVGFVGTSVFEYQGNTLKLPKQQSLLCVQ